MPCNIELLTLIGRQGYVGCQFPEPDTVAQWRQTFMEGWERTIDDLEPKGDHKTKRREVLQRTFDDLLEASKAARG